MATATSGACVANRKVVGIDAARELVQRRESSNGTMNVGLLAVACDLELLLAWMLGLAES